MSEIVDITDREPNPQLIAMLERLLAQARAGDIRSAVIVSSWDNNGCTTSWVLDDRTYTRMLFAELVLAQHEMAMNVSLKDDGILPKAIRGEL